MPRVLQRGTRREFLATTTAAATSGLLTPQLAALTFAGTPREPDIPRAAGEQLRFAVIGAGWRPDIRRVGRGVALGQQAAKLGEVPVVCEVDTIARDFALDRITSGRGVGCDDFHDVLARDDIDAVIIATPDHWHVPIAIAALQAGKHVYCEKPATVTIAEGRRLVEEAARHSSILQIGTQQRTEVGRRFLQAIALVREGRLGPVQSIRVGVDEGLAGGPFPVRPVPPTLDFDRWLGPAPAVAYRPERTHWTFRWWSDYAGGKLTDWGAHHVDIAQWALGQLHTGPTRLKGSGRFPQPLQEGRPTREDTYDMPTTFSVVATFEGVAENGSPRGGERTIPMTIDSSENGILIEGEAGRLFVNRGRLSGKPVEDLAARPLRADAIERVARELPWGAFGRPLPSSHMAHFVDCIRQGATPISDVATHHQTLTTCHLANIAVRLGRPLRWDAASERFVDDPVADGFLSRADRREIAAS